MCSNRGNGRRQLFLKDGDYLAFLKLLAEVREAVPLTCWRTG
ncbi:MAG TPA: hypothetical protein VFE47_20275 [Tepidisphaeraceae bacterium]|jgi:hypothetical protein|nr:hypothetical protein [Tepidisphaeraceae bacterium]